jgi:hypothetical protein
LAKINFEIEAVLMKNISLLRVVDNEQLNEDIEYYTSAEYFQFLCDCYSKFQNESPDEYVFLYGDRLPEELAYFELDKGEQDDILH